jgi:hypothetical protein
METGDDMNCFAVKPEEQTVWEPPKPGAADIFENQRECQGILDDRLIVASTSATKREANAREYAKYQSDASIISVRAAGPKTANGISRVAVEAQP